MSERKGTKALELWCKRLVKDCPDIQIDNMTTSWRNGMAFCALVHHFRPDLIDISTLKPENVYENNQLAFNVAEKHLGIPALLDPEDMVENEVPDRLSILTYLSQFYQRLGHTVNTKISESETKFSKQSTITATTTTTTPSTTPIKFGKVGLDKCTACGLPVYLAQRLIVSHKLYHRRCFRCSKCSGHMNPKNYQIIEGTEFTCDSCKNETTISRFLNNNDQIGMLAFNEDLSKTNKDIQTEDPIYPKPRSKPQSILEKISMFENNVEKDTSIGDKLGNLSLKDNLSNKYKELNTSSAVDSTSLAQNKSVEKVSTDKQILESKNIENESLLYKNLPEKVYKSNIKKFNFLQTQLSGDILDADYCLDNVDITETKHNDNNLTNVDEKTHSHHKEADDKSIDAPTIANNITDDTRIAITHSSSSNLNSIHSIEPSEPSKNEQEINISAPPRRKKHLSSAENTMVSMSNKDDKVRKSENKEYPGHLNPFSDDEEENEEHKEVPKKVSTNPFGSSDEEEDDIPPIHPPPKVPVNETSTPIKRLISAYNPFWSDGEEPSSDEDTSDRSAKMYKSSMTTSTPNLPSSTPRRKKAKAPPPPPVITVSEAPHLHHTSTSMDDVASISSISSYNSTVHFDQKSLGRSTPKLKKKRPAPTPPDSLSTVSGGGESLEKVGDTSSIRNASEGGGRRVKGPAPGLPLPERREVKLQMSPEELQVQLDLLETQQLGLERQGVLIEQMIRDKCEGDEGTSVPQEEVEDLVIQLCELVNEKNDLFRKQTELMYIRRQQRLEQEQADIEHEIRVIQSQPAVNRIDADKVREEQLVLRLVEIVRMRDELVQQIDAERRRERQEDLAIAASIANKRAQRNSESNSSSMKSVEVVATPKKNKVKDKVKKQLKKAKHTLIPKKKDDSSDRKEDKIEKEKKSK